MEQPWPPLIATFRPQRWVGDRGDVLEDIPLGEVVFVATQAFLRQPLEQLRRYRSHSYESDRLAEDLPARQAHHGPFEVDVNVNAWLGVHGCNETDELTEEDLETLRRRFPPPTTNAQNRLEP